MDQHDYPILEFDPDPNALIAPGAFSDPLMHADVPQHCVICFFPEVIAKIVAEYQPTLIKNLRSEIGAHPVYLLEAVGRRFAFYHPGVGAPLGVGLLEEVIAIGCRKFIACGGAGVLDREIAVGNLMIPRCAVRDEGTSYHYLPPSREVEASPEGIAAIEATLQANHVDYLIVKTWPPTASTARLRPGSPHGGPRAA